ncbi:sodium-dependent dicarboxylate transporter 2/3/5 [Roseimicrobium gellanilyticum]|uniref:Sodium-dependent dicarboxylate transporter 2/3/5 n=1 Tax=Roseimicrobium gellanilyticum TaxID=748857 RepID=A0A366HBV0_9BACT|nr:DASS family sodium-coupled anion symporter [Roseimicrobium gellanilyticum]RBP39823.1 sodium-dependent dicarboxylate transporter 2/3/5 [Roseimicrobium gellanilyticum]
MSMNDDARPDQLVDEEGNLLEGGYGLRQKIGLFLGLALLLFTLVAPPMFGLPAPASKVALLAITMAVLWVTEAVPIPATALLPLVLLPILGVSPVDESAAPYADRIIFLFMGGFILALAMERWSLHRRIALTIIDAVGTKPRALIMGFLCAGTFISMWASNSATAMMLLPIGISVYGLLKEGGGATLGAKEFGAALVLSIAYGANIGGLGTLIGTPPNALLAGHMHDQHKITVGFGQWMLLGVPLILVSLPLVYLILTRLSFKVPNDEVPGLRNALHQERTKLGRMSKGEWAVAGAFSLAIVLWISRELWKGTAIGKIVTDEVIAMGAATLLFFVPLDMKKGIFVMDWASMKKLPWDVLILFGGGLSLAAAFKKTKLVDAMATAMQGLSDWPPVAIVFLVTAVMVVATALTSNTATTAAFLPVISGLAAAVNQPAILLCVPVAIAASADFALPVGTPPNAIAYGSGLVSLPRMVKAGIWVDLLFVLLIPIMMWTVGRWVFKV